MNQRESTLKCLSNNTLIHWKPNCAARAETCCKGLLC